MMVVQAVTLNSVLLGVIKQRALTKWYLNSDTSPTMQIINVYCFDPVD